MKMNITGIEDKDDVYNLKYVFNQPVVVSKQNEKLPIENITTTSGLKSVTEHSSGKAVLYFPSHYLWCMKFLGDSRYSHGTNQSLACFLLRPRKGLFLAACWFSGT